MNYLKRKLLILLLCLFPIAHINDQYPYNPAINSRDQILYGKKIQSDSLVFQKLLDPGRYYWSIEEKKEALVYGMYFINTSVDHFKEKTTSQIQC